MDDNVELYELLENEVFARTNHSATDLPPPNTKRWVARRKAVVVNAVRSGAISLEEVCRRYELSVEEFLAWQRAIDTHGVASDPTTDISRHSSRSADQTAVLNSSPRRCGKPWRMRYRFGRYSIRSQQPGPAAPRSGSKRQETAHWPSRTSSRTARRCQPTEKGGINPKFRLILIHFVTKPQ